MAPEDFPAGGYPRDYVLFWAIWAAILAVTVTFFRRRRGRSGAVRLVAGNLLVLLSLAWGVLLAAETYFRYVYDATDAYGVTLTNRAWFLRHAAPNAAKFRDREWSEARVPGTERVVCVGDSFTFGYGVPDRENCWPQRLGTLLRDAPGGPFDVRNYGIVGLDTGDATRVTQYAFRVGGADRVILGYCLNDIDDLAPPGRRFDRGEAPRVPFLPPTFSFTADFLWFRLRLRDDPRVCGYFDWIAEEHADARLMAEQAARFRRIRAIAGESGKRLDVVVFPFFATWGDGYRFDACHERIAAAWKSAGVDVLDLRDAYRGIPGTELVVSRLDAHPNERAHDIAARAVAARWFR